MARFYDEIPITDREMDEIVFEVVSEIYDGWFRHRSLAELQDDLTEFATEVGQLIEETQHDDSL